MIPRRERPARKRRGVLLAMAAGLLLAGAAGAAGPAAAGDALDDEDRRLFADGLFGRGFHELALREYEALAARQPPPDDLDVVLFRLAECRRLLGRPLEAEAVFRRLAADFPQSPLRDKAILKRALIILDPGQAEAAAELLEQLAAARPEPELLAAALYHAGEARERMGRTDEARARYEELRRILPDSPFAAFAALRLANIFGREGTPAATGRAIELCKEVAARPPDSRAGAEALFQGAMLAFNMGRHEESATLFRQLAARFPDDERAREASGPSAWAHYHAGRHLDALRLADAALAAGTAPADEMLYLKANAERQLERRREAIATYDRLLATTPRSPYAVAARYERLLTLFREGDHARVLKDAADFADPPPDIADDLLWLQAESAEALKDDARVVQCYRLLLKKFPDSELAADAAYRLACHLQRRQDWEEASRVYLDLVARYPTNALVPKALFASGLCLAQAGHSDAALRDWHALLTRFPDHETVPEALFQKAMEEMRRGADRDAAATLDELLRRFPAYPRIAEALFWRARHYYAAKELAAAEKTVRACLAAHPPTAVEREATYLLGLILQAEGREEEAAAVFQPLLAAPIREKFAPERLAWLAEFQFGRQAFAESEAAARSLLEQAPSPEWRQVAWTLIGRSLSARRRPEEAIKAFGEALATGARTRHGAEAALRMGELLLAAGHVDEAEVRLRDAATRAVTPELLGIRAGAYAALGRAAEQRGDLENAVRYHMSVAILFDDPVSVPQALDRAAGLLEKLGRVAESRAAAAELCERYPQSAEAARWRARLAAPPPPGGAAAPAAGARKP